MPFGITKMLLLDPISNLFSTADETSSEILF